jgi:hypothetical protein
MQGAAESCQALLNATHSINDHPTMIMQLVRMTGQEVSVRAIERLLGQGTASEKQLAQLQTLLEREAADELLYHAMRGERAGGHQVYTLLQTGKMAPSELLKSLVPNGDDPPDWLIDSLGKVLMRGYAEQLQMYNDHVAASKLPVEKQLKAFQKIDQQLRQYAGQVPARYTLMKLMMPATLKVAERHQHSQASLRCAITAVAAERYRIAHKRWPASAEDLVKGKLLKEVFKDPYDGEPLRWRHTTGATVYSVGPDKIDNGGKFDRNNWRAVGTDIGFELWEPRFRHVPPLLVKDGSKNR